MLDYSIRRLRPTDSLDGLTALLHRAFRDLALQGIACECGSQSVERTRERVARGDCFVAVSGGALVGTVTLEKADRSSSIAAYRDPGTASVHQLAVEPARQGAGVGRALITQAAAWARARRFARLALDTPEGALKQLAWYVDRGFDRVGTVHVAGRRHASVVLARTVSAGPAGMQAFPTRRPFQPAAR